jgi:hypothetical protein
MASIGVIVNFCTNELCFLDSLLIECHKFSNDVVVSYTDKLYNGELEDTSFVDVYKSKYPGTKFVKYELDLDKPPKELKGVVHRPLAYWHNLARYTAVQSLAQSTEWVFVIDADEIPEGDRVASFIKTTTLNQCWSYKIATFWYFKLPIFQSKTYEDSILLIHKKHLTEDNIFGDMERDFLIVKSRTSLQRMVMGSDRLPMFHHFSWVRSHDGIRKKVSSWAHRLELGMTVDMILERMFKNDEVNDIIHGYAYNIVDNKFDIVL